MSIPNFRDGKILNLIKKDIYGFKYNVGDTVNGLTITDLEYKVDKNGINRKWYRYICNQCGWDKGIIIEGALSKGNGCSCCSNQIVVEGINDIPTTAPWMIKFFQGGHDEAKLYTKSSSKIINPICPDCLRIKKKSIRIYTLYKEGKIGCNCGDGFSYSEKFIFNLLEQLGIEFITQLSKSNFQWCNKYRYDFYVCHNKMIIETHGEQHYKEKSKDSKWNNLDQEKERDKSKRILAINNGIKSYIELDCRESDLEWIKSSVLKSELATLYDLSQIDWEKCHEFSMNNLSKRACDYWNRKKDYETTIDLCRKFNIDRSTVIKYLKKWTDIGYCNYDANIENIKNNKRHNQRNKKFNKRVCVYKNGDPIRVYESLSNLDKRSINDFGVRLNFRNVSSVCLGKLKQYKGYTFKYLDE